MFIIQCCGTGAGGAEIILEPGAGAGSKFLLTFFAVSFEDARMGKKGNFYFY